MFNQRSAKIKRRRENQESFLHKKMVAESVKWSQILCYISDLEQLLWLVVFAMPNPCRYKILSILIFIKIPLQNDQFIDIDIFKKANVDIDNFKKAYIDIDILKKSPYWYLEFEILNQISHLWTARMYILPILVFAVGYNSPKVSSIASHPIFFPSIISYQ